MRTLFTLHLILAISLVGGPLHFEPGRFGGKLTVAQRAEPKTFNPVTALDAASKEVIGRMTADLITINRATQEAEPSLAKSWSASKDGLHYTLRLRDGLQFSDGHACDAADVVFTFEVYLDEKLGSTQRGQLTVGGQPVKVTQLDARRVRFDFAARYAAAERIFDGVPILPRHQLERAWKEGRLAQSWSLGVKPNEIAGLGAFRLKEYRPGERIVLERNPYYWKFDGAGRRLPYLDELDFLFIPSEEAQVLRFQSGELDVLNRVGSRNSEILTSKSGSAAGLSDLGPSLEYAFLFFNQGAPRERWFREAAFRQAVSSAIDRESIVRLVFHGRAAGLWGHVPPGNRLWIDAAIPKPARSLERSKDLLRGAGYRWDGDGKLLDAAGKRVEFSIITTAGNSDRQQMAAIVQEDLRKLGMDVTITPLESRALIDRVTRSRQYDACVLALGGGTGDPNSEMNVWLSSGATHLWNPAEKIPATVWEAEIDDLMNRQMTTLEPGQRRKLYNRVQEIVADQLPVIPLVSPHVLVAAKPVVGNFHPAVLDHYTLWNAEYLFVRPTTSGAH